MIIVNLFKQQRINSTLVLNKIKLKSTKQIVNTGLIYLILIHINKFIKTILIISKILLILVYKYFTHKKMNKT